MDAVLRQLRQLRDRREADEAQEVALVAEARRHGLTWDQIADALGRTRSAVWKKHHLHGR